MPEPAVFRSWTCNVGRRSASSCGIHAGSLCQSGRACRVCKGASSAGGEREARQKRWITQAPADVSVGHGGGLGHGCRAPQALLYRLPVAEMGTPQGFPKFAVVGDGEGEKFHAPASRLGPRKGAGQDRFVSRMSSRKSLRRGDAKQEGLGPGRTRARRMKFCPKPPLPPPGITVARYRMDVVPGGPHGCPLWSNHCSGSRSRRSV